MLYLTQETYPSDEPITVETLSAHLRLNDTTWEADLLQGWITAARQDFEARTQRQLLPAQFKLSLPRWINPTYLPRGPVQSIDSIEYRDGNGNIQTLLSSLYALDSRRDMGMVRFLANYPSLFVVDPFLTGLDPLPISITFTAGYTETGSGSGATNAVPQLIKQGITLLAAEMYRSREALTDKPLTELPFGYQSIVNLYKLNFVSELNDYQYPYNYYWYRLLYEGR